MNQTFDVTGMSCGHCKASITEAVRTLDERAQVHINLETGEVTVDSALTSQQIVDAITELGFEATVRSTFAAG
jgi:copper chaperone